MSTGGGYGTTMSYSPHSNRTINTFLNHNSEEIFEENVSKSKFKIGYVALVPKYFSSP